MKPIKVLIVDDDVPLTQLIARILTKSGRYATCVENDPRSAHSAAERFDPDVFLLDVDMPARDGGVVLADLRQSARFAHKPAAFLTSLISAKETGFGIAKRGGERFIAKTLDLGVLDRCIHQLIEADT